MLDLTALTLAQVPQFTSMNALSTLLTVESLMFTVLNVAITASLPSPTGARVVARPKLAASGVALVITIAAVGAGAAWWDLFQTWPDVPIGWVASGAIALAIVAEPLLTWTIVAGMLGDG